jgi:hypothetical protein
MNDEEIIVQAFIFSYFLEFSIILSHQKLLNSLICQFKVLVSLVDEFSKFILT